MKVNVKPIAREFKLMCDPDGLAAVRIRQATQGDNLRRDKLYEEQSWRNSGTDRELVIRWNREELKRKEVFMTLVGATDLEDENGNPLFRFKEGKNGPELAMSEPEFNAVWDSLPSNLGLGDEIHGYVLQVNPDWGVGSGE